MGEPRAAASVYWSMRLRSILLACLGALTLRAQVPEPVPHPLLGDAVHSWLDERDYWAFTQRVREFENDELKRERLERYDPSRPDAERWELLEFNGRPATPAEREAWSRRKNRKPRKHTSPIAEYFDFKNARLAEESSRTARYELPLKSTKQWLFPVDKVTLSLTIDKETRAIQTVRASIREPFNVALGLAKVLDVDLDVDTELPADEPPRSDPASANPSGVAKVVVRKFGDRAEYSWSEFKRVTPHPSRKQG
jgi:hypothetical protein